MDAMSGMVSDTLEDFEDPFQAASVAKTPLHLVFAIDEASTCPLLVRSIIPEMEDAYAMVREAIHLEIHFCDGSLINVQFSVAGAGLSASTAGSLSDKFVALPATIEGNNKLKENLLRSVPSLYLPGRGGVKVSISDRNDDLLPVIAVLIENGRMASIAVAVLKQQPPVLPVVEARLVALT
jgi:hypothetical protein